MKPKKTLNQPKAKSVASDDKPKEYCGVFGIFNNSDAAAMTFYGLHALQHRGQESAGIVTSDYDDAKKRRVFHVHKDFGLVTDIFKDEAMMKTLTGKSAIGHNRYSTAGSANRKENIQPFSVMYRYGNIALGHNGNFSNARKLRKHLRDEGVIFQATSDSELVLHLVARSKESDQIEQIREALTKVEGAFSLVILTDDKLIACRDPHGWRPMAIGTKKNADGTKSYVVASETCAFDIIEATYLRDVEVGEIIVIDADTVKTGNIKSYKLPKARRKAQCIFEYVYFSRPDSMIFGESVDKVRRKIGKNLAHEGAVDIQGDETYVTVISVPDSSNTAALGFVTESNKLGKPARFELGLIRNHYVGRTFIQPGDKARANKVRSKYNVVKGVLKGKRIVVVDDSIVRGTTSKALIKLLREAGPKEIHLRISSPPIMHPCFYGMDFPTKEKLIANQFDGDVEKIRKELGVDSLIYLSMEGLLKSATPHGSEKDDYGYCTACFSGHYPIPIDNALTDKEENE
jgi:amidophosphoribosyltransferase